MEDLLVEKCWRKIVEHDGEIWTARGGCACAQADSRKGSSREPTSHPARLNIFAALILRRHLYERP